MKDPRTHRPPPLAERLFSWYCRKASAEDLRGDLDELFHIDLTRMSAGKAKLLYWQRVFSLIFSYAVKKRKHEGSHHPFSSGSFNPYMFSNYFLIAVRSLSKHKFFTIINVLGLAIGMSVSVMFISLMSYLWTYEDFHINRDRIYRVISLTDDGERRDDLASAPAPLSEKLNGYEGIEEVVRISSVLRATAQHGPQEVPLQGYFTDQDFLKVFTFPLLRGNASLAKPNSLLITESAAKKMFGDGDPIGKVITMGQFGDYEITGVLKDVPKNSHFYFEVLASYSTLELTANQKLLPEDPWEDFRNFYTYLLLKNNPGEGTNETTVSAIETSLSAIASEVYRDRENFKATFELQSINDITPGPELRNQIGPEWGYVGLGVFLSLTLLILLPACFNYANISISRALKRAKEIGLRKTMGGQRSQIFTQFILETVLINLIALFGAFAIFIVVRNEFISLLVPNSGLELNADLVTVWYFILFAIVVGFLSGIVPALYFSRLNPIEALKSNLKAGRNGSFGLRKVLVVVQFALSFGFIMCVVVTLELHKTSVNYDFGFTQDGILTVNLRGVKQDIFRNEFSKLSPVQSIALSSHIPGTADASLAFVMTDGAKDSTEAFTMAVDENFISTYDLRLISGKTFSAAPGRSTNEIIVNEEFVKHFELGSPAEALNKTMVLQGGEAVKIAGVMKDFHYMDLQHPVKSFFFRYDPAQFSFASMKVTENDRFKLITSMESAWKTLGTEQKFEGNYLADMIADAYHFHFSIVKICGFLGGLAISISCLGLLGMVVFTVENRMKEVGVRKVMGASAAGVAYLLSSDFLKLMIIGSLIAIPFAWFFCETAFLRMQVYTIHVGISEVLISLALVLILGLTTILSQTYKAAQANPADTLRYE